MCWGEGEARTLSKLVVSDQQLICQCQNWRTFAGQDPVPRLQYRPSLANSRSRHGRGACRARTAHFLPFRGWKNTNINKSMLLMPSCSLGRNSSSGYFSVNQFLRKCFKCFTCLFLKFLLLSYFWKLQYTFICFIFFSCPREVFIRQQNRKFLFSFLLSSSVMD